MKNLLSSCLIGLTLLGLANGAKAERIKDIASVAGVRSNQLVGYGIVVGLDGTGDQTSQTPFTVQSLTNMLAQNGIALPPGANPQLKNIAAVSIHAELPAFAKVGQTIDITVSSIGNAKSLRGGSLLMSPLKGADGQVYAVAQGNLVVSGFGAAADGSSVTVNVPSAGRIPGGATVERVVANPFGNGDGIVLNLHSADFTTATQTALSINQTMGLGTAQALDGASIRVNAPLSRSQRVAFVSLLENLEVITGDAAAKVIVNSRTGTVVIGQNVRVKPAAVSHGSLVVTISANPIVSQPGPLAVAGQTVVVPQSDIAITEGDNKMFLFNPGVSLDEIVRAVNQVGAAPGDLVAILEALKQSGSLSAELIII
ncbi:flagellar basal body P-ring protein FlgI [Sulfuriflexus mobilis]|uniref:flagellar basal body P-ring protein FlgI n=1 Tax=Sulfuriflexus mobilis TaxID=1811807 RepID=UPI000F828F11|nr:flagellar basal body P-ring protein FlgI [Sulfuriflexus mobilis]